MRRTRQDLGFVALKIEGGILPAEFLQKVVALEAKGQAPKDYKLPKGTTIKDEIGRAWRIASAEWREYRDGSQRQDVDKTKLGVDQWLVTLFKVVLGHDDIHPCSVIHAGDRTFPITHKSVAGALPLVLTTEGFRLDKTDARFGEAGRRRSPHALMQEFLNARQECLWGFISNGRIIQLLRDNPSLTKPAYIEADLERIFEEQLYSDFAAMWLMFHGSRFACAEGKPSECFMEEWRRQGHETGERALNDLRNGVTTALKELGNGFLQASQNTALKEALNSGELSAEDYFRELLRLVYRFLFLLCVEDREQLHPADSTEQARWLYKRGYSLSRLRECALLKRNYDKHQDMWEALHVTFQGLRWGEGHLALPALGGLFAESHCPYIEQSVIENQYLLRAIFGLSFFRTGDVLARVNYRDMGTEELGSVYESLLELHPYIDVGKSPWTFEFVGEGEGAGGSERKLSGSYYTPASLVNELLRSAVDPVIEEAKRSNAENPRKALLDLKIIDPACGSGHFLLAAARRLAIEIAKLDQTSEMSEEAARRHALREVVKSCIYGVDKNELALELCKTALWIEAVEPGRPLNFLDAHLRCGDSLVGILDPEVIDKGIPDEAYEALAGDDKATVSELKKRNKNDKYEHAVVQGSVFDQKSMTMLAESREAVNEMPEETIEQIEAKQEAFKKWLGELAQSEDELKANIYVGAFFAEKKKETISTVPRTEDLNRLKRGMPVRTGVVETCRKLAQQYKFFHWHLAFSEVFNKGGFDIVLGNPPWEQIQLDDREFFSTRQSEIANAMNMAARNKLVGGLEQENPILYAEYCAAKRTNGGIQNFIHSSGRYPLTSYGRLNSAPLFSELALALVGKRGRVGVIVPTGIATDSFNQYYFRQIVDKRLLVSLYDFENRKKLFPAVDSRMKFSLVTLTGAGRPVEHGSDFVFFALDVEDLKDRDRHFTLSAEDIALLNPNTGTCAIFRSRKDAELTKKIYRRVPVLVKEGPPEENPWGLRLMLMFMMNTDSVLFHTRRQLEEAGYVLEGNVFIKRAAAGASGAGGTGAGTGAGEGATGACERYLPLYEAKMIHQFDHRWATYENGKARDVTLAEKQDPNFVVMPRYWVAEREVQAKLAGKWDHPWLLGWRDICRSTDERTVIASFLPRVAVGHTCPLMFIADDNKASLADYLLANLCSLVLDYVARQKIGGIHLTFGFLNQLPVLPPAEYASRNLWKGESLLSWIAVRVKELVGASSDLVIDANGGGSAAMSHWDLNRRKDIRAELDALYFHLYGLERDDVEYILDTFPIVRQKDEKEYGSYRTKELILRCFDAMSAAIEKQTTYVSILDPPPGASASGRVPARAAVSREED